MREAATQAMWWHRRGAATKQMPPRRLQPFGLFGIARDLIVARRQRCHHIASSSLLDIARNTNSASCEITDTLH
jgi:hypothetical protein